MSTAAYIRIILSILAAFVLSFLLSLSEAYLMSGAVLIAAAFILFLYIIKQGRRLIHPAALFILSWVGGTGVSALKLSSLQTDWSPVSWICFFLAAVCFTSGYAAAERFFTCKACRRSSIDTLSGKASVKSGELTLGVDEIEAGRAKGLFAAICIVSFLSVLAFITEAYILGYVPLFTVDTPHAYSYFHVSGLHYFTVSCVLVPSLEVIWFKLYNEKYKSRPQRVLFLAVLFISLLIPVLLVSRFQLIFAVLLCIITYLVLSDVRPSFKINKRLMICLAAAFLSLILAYIFITYERAHSIEYLNGIFEMKAELPIFISQPYIYIANNFDNFNCLVTSLAGHTRGLKMLFPVFALTGMKFSHPELVSFPLYVTKEELTTVTLIYDAYYDFGAAGVIGFCFILGFIAALLYDYLKRHDFRPATAVFIYAQLMFYLMFSFFTTWFSNPAVWFYIIATIAIGIFVRIFAAFAFAGQRKSYDS